MRRRLVPGSQIAAARLKKRALERLNRPVDPAVEKLAATGLGQPPTEMATSEAEPLVTDDDAVWIHPARRSGEPCVGGTRVPVEMVIASVWAHGIDTAMDTYVLTRVQVLHACWYAGAGNVVRLHGKGGGYVAYRGPWRKRWGLWAKQAHEGLWTSDVDDDEIPNPPASDDR